jgi:small nuclear ribonucleoprotein (snRNP)-like protein
LFPLTRISITFASLCRRSRKPRDSDHRGGTAICDTVPQTLAGKQNKRIAGSAATLEQEQEQEHIKPLEDLAVAQRAALAACSMTTDLGARHAPDVQLDLRQERNRILAAQQQQHARTGTAPPGDDSSSSSAAVSASRSEQEIADMNWLCGLIGCISPLDVTSGPRAIPVPTPLSIRVSLYDGRVYSGRLHCIDSRVNLILSHASQLPSVIDGIEVGGFQIGQILISWKLVKKVEQQEDPLSK